MEFEYQYFMNKRNASNSMVTAFIIDHDRPSSGNKNRVISAAKEIRHFKEKIKTITEEIYYSKELLNSTGTKIKHQLAIIERLEEYIDDMKLTIEIKKENGEVYRPRGEKVEIALLKKEVNEGGNQIAEMEKEIVSKDEEHNNRIKEQNKIINSIEDELIYIFNKIQEFDINNDTFNNVHTDVNLRKSTSPKHNVQKSATPEIGITFIEENLEKVDREIKERLDNIEKINTKNVMDIKSKYNQKRQSSAGIPIHMVSGKKQSHSNLNYILNSNNTTHYNLPALKRNSQLQTIDFRGRGGKRNSILDNFNFVNNIGKVQKNDVKMYLSEDKRKPFKPLLFEK